MAAKIRRRTEARVSEHTLWPSLDILPLTPGMREMRNLGTRERIARKMLTDFSGRLVIQLIQEGDVLV
jgi:hypothetical protein